jgi:hypothetical protein
MNVRRLIAQVAAALVITATALALVPSSAQAMGSLHHGPSISKPVSLNYWHHHRRWHRRWHRGYWH